MTPFFTQMVDEMIELAETDPELKAGLQWIDMESRKKRITFYQAVFDVLYRYELEQKAKEWMRNRN